MRAEISASFGQEVLFIGRLDDDGTVGEIEVFARGSTGMVTAPTAEHHVEPLIAQAERGEIVIHNHPSGRLVASDADVSVASYLAERGIGSAIVDNEVTSIYVLVEPARVDTLVPVDVDEVVGLLSDDGPIANYVDGFSRRQSQVEMSARVARAFNEERVLLAEAGTGVGKSFAYLLPAIQWVTHNAGRIVIATATINLQQQLVERDIPVLARALGATVDVALVKGRGNYICPRRLKEQISEADLFSDGDEYRAIADWAEDSETGSRSELPMFLTDEAWSRINSDADSCSVTRCPNRDRCFVFKARMRATRARILVANHHVLFSDLHLRRAGIGWETSAVLPPFKRIIFDEAHNIERAATSFFSESFSRFALRRQTSRILRRRGRHRFGVLDKIAALEVDARAVAATETALESLEKEIDRLNSTLTAFLVPAFTWRLTPETGELLATAAGTELREARRQLIECLDVFVRLYRSIPEDLREDPDAGTLLGTIRRMEAYASVLDRFIDSSDVDESVLWIERRSPSRGDSWATLIATPLDIRTVMEETVFGRMDTVVMTSATLTVDEKFDFWGGRIGIPTDDRVDAGSHPSPFDYQNRVLLAVPSDAPAPTSGEYNTYLGEFLPRLVGRVGGGALLLFTSYRQLEEIYTDIAPLLEGRGITCHRQGAEDRTRLLEQFRSDESSVLFATDSFWEGIDAPGATLRLVVVCRLPFRVPTDPVQEARAEAIVREGGNSFYQFSLPQAVIKLKQGFGRLMRRTDDYGAVVVTDSRLLTKPYGRIFLDSLPLTARLAEPGEELVERVGEFFGGFAEQKKTASSE